MDPETILPFVLAFFSLAAFNLGSFVRNRVHVLMPWKDPVTLILMLIAFSPVIGEISGHHILDITNHWYLAFLISFVGCYSFAYIRGEFDMMMVCVHTSRSQRFPNGAREYRPMVYYWTDDGLYVQEQGMKEILKTVLFGIRSPLDFPMDMIERTTTVHIETVMMPTINFQCADMLELKVGEESIKKWIFTFRYRSYSYTPAPQCTLPFQAWIACEANNNALTHELTRSQAELFRAKQEAMSGRVAQAADMLVHLVADHTPQSDVMADLEERLRPYGEERMRMKSEEKEPEPRKKSIFRRKERQEEDE